MGAAQSSATLVALSMIRGRHTSSWIDGTEDYTPDGLLWSVRALIGCPTAPGRGEVWARLTWDGESFNARCPACDDFMDDLL